MTEAEALDMAAKAAGWLDGWDFMTAEGGLMFAQSIRAHAKTIMENAALKAENERLRGYAEHGKRNDGEACSAAWVKGADCDCGLSALLEEIEGD